MNKIYEWTKVNYVVERRSMHNIDHKLRCFDPKIKSNFKIEVYLLTRRIYL